MPDDAVPGNGPITPPEAPPQTTKAQTVSKRIGAEIRTWRFWSIALSGLVAVYILAIVRPFGGAVPVLTSDEVAQQWNESIARLGIQAVYPLQEDFQVGDIWAIVAVAPGKPILGKSVRVGHIDLKQYVIDADNERPVFSDTAELVTGKTVRLNVRSESIVNDQDKRKVATAIAAFPTITINHTASSASAAREKANCSSRSTS
jgi:hypothetical protein